MTSPARVVLYVQCRVSCLCLSCFWSGREDCLSSWVWIEDSLSSDQASCWRLPNAFVLRTCPPPQCATCSHWGDASTLCAILCITDECKTCKTCAILYDYGWLLDWLSASAQWRSSEWYDMWRVSFCPWLVFRPPGTDVILSWVAPPVLLTQPDLVDWVYSVDGGT